MQALDHDFHVHGIVPSVAFFVDVPEDDFWYIFQRSCLCDKQIKLRCHHMQ